MPDQALSNLEIIAAASLVLAVLGFVFLALRKPQSGNALAAAALASGFGAFTLAVAATEGAEILWLNQTANLWGIQLWLDLLLSALIAFCFIVPRAARAGMNIPLWTLFVVASLSVGLLAMAARLFWLEGRTANEG